MGRYDMIRQSFAVNSFWEVIVYYDVDYNLFDVIYKELIDSGISEIEINDIYNNMKSNTAKAVTISNIETHISIVLFNAHSSKADYINSIVHEAEHIKQAMLMAYKVKDKGETPAYTIGYLISKMYEVFRELI